jgi:hypothetical protein
LAKLILLDKFEADKVDLSITVKVGIGFEIVLDGDWDMEPSSGSYYRER